MEAAAGASALLVVTEWREFRSPDFTALHAAMKRPLLLDGRNLYEPARMAELGFEHVGIGRAVAGVSPVDASLQAAGWAAIPVRTAQAA